MVAPLASVGWKELETTAAQIIRAVTLALELPADSLIIEEFSGISAPTAPVGLAISAAPGATERMAPERAAEICAVAQGYLAQIQICVLEEQGELFTPAIVLEPSVGERLQAQVLADLTVVGGKSIRTPMVLEAGGERLLLAGTFGSKPLLPRLPPERVELVGGVVGINSYRKRLQILTGECSEEELECDPKRFVHLLRDAIHTPRRFVFGAMCSMDARGREERTLCDFREIEPLSSDPAYLL